MARWDWLEKASYNWRFVRNVVLKAAVLFITLNVLYVALEPLPWLSRISFYNSVVPGRERLPFSQNPDDAYSVSVQRIEGMVAAHTINNADPDAYNVVFIGDSSVWGWLLEPDETLTACLNMDDLQTSDGRVIVAHNLGYPVLSAFKDFMLLDYALQRYDVDAVVWLTSLQSVFTFEQLRHPITDNNPDRARTLFHDYDLMLDADGIATDGSLVEQSIVGQRRELADLVRHQLYGVAWSLTQIDHTNPLFYEARAENLLANEDILSEAGVVIDGPLQDFIALDVLDAGIAHADDANADVLLVNQPIFRAEGNASDIRYNNYYPRALYDRYRELMQTRASEQGWTYADLWDALPNDVFTDSPFHYTADGACQFADILAPRIIELAATQEVNAP
jgi:hypothetical protein